MSEPTPRTDAHEELLGYGERYFPSSRVRQETFSLDEGGQVVVQWPASMIAVNYIEFKEWIDLLMRKIARQNRVSAEPEKKPETSDGRGMI